MYIFIISKDQAVLCIHIHMDTYIHTHIYTYLHTPAYKKLNDIVKWKILQENTAGPPLINGFTFHNFGSHWSNYSPKV